MVWLSVEHLILQHRKVRNNTMASQNPNLLKRLYENVMGTPEQNAKAEKDIAAYKAAKEKEKEKEKKDKEKEGKTAMAKGGAVKKKKVKMAAGGTVGGRQVMPAAGSTGRNPEWAARAAQRQVARQVRQDTREKEKAARQATVKPAVPAVRNTNPNPLIKKTLGQQTAMEQTAMAKGGDVKLKSAPKAAKAGKAKPVLAIMIGVPKGKAKMAKGGKVTKKKGC